MKYLIDSCVISELIKNKPNENVINWITRNDEQYLFLNTLILWRNLQTDRKNIEYIKKKLHYLNG